MAIQVDDGTPKPLREIRSEADLVGWMQTNRDRERDRVRAAWAEWVENLAAFHNRPDLRASYDLRTLRRLSPKQERELENIVVNLVQPHVRTVAAKHQKANPILNVLPSTSDEADVQAAKVGDRMILSEWRQQRMDQRRLEAAVWLGCVGNAFWHTFYNRDAGPQVFQGVAVGQIETVTVSPFKVVVEPHRTSIDKARWCMVDEMQPIEVLQAAYAREYLARTGEELRLSSTDTDEGQKIFSYSGPEGNLGDLLLSMVGLPGRDDLKDEEYVTTSTLYHLPSPRFPEGMYAILAGRKLLHVGRFPYRDTQSGRVLPWLPVFHFKEVLCPWRLLGDTTATHVKQAQDVYNELRNIELKTLKDRAAPKLFVPEGVYLDENAALDRESRIVRYRPKQGMPVPEWARGDSPPASLTNSMSQALEEANRSSGINEPTRGNATPNATSGRAILALQDQDDTRMGLSVKLSEDEYSRWGSTVLFMAKQFYSEPRKYSVSGDALRNGVWFFDRAQLRDCTDVVCQAGSAMPQNKVAKQQNVMGFFQAGILGNPQDPEAQIRARRMLEFGQHEDLHDDDAMDEGVAEKENEAMVALAGQAVQAGIMDPMLIAAGVAQAGIAPERWDNHGVHIKCHLRRFKMAGVRDNPVFRLVIQTHIDMHTMAMQGGSIPTNSPQAVQDGLGAQEARQGPTQTAPAQEAGKVAPVALQSGDHKSPNDLQITPGDVGGNQ